MAMIIDRLGDMYISQEVEDIIPALPLREPSNLLHLSDMKLSLALHWKNSISDRAALPY